MRRRIAIAGTLLAGCLWVVSSPSSSSVSLSIAVSAAAAGQDEALITRGQQVYTEQKCQVCHAIAGKGSKMNPLDGVGARLSADDLRRWITHPDEMTAKTKSTKKPPMPKKYDKLSKEDLDALVAYMQSLK